MENLLVYFCGMRKAGRVESLFCLKDDRPPCGSELRTASETIAAAFHPAHKELSPAVLMKSDLARFWLTESCAATQVGGARTTTTNPNRLIGHAFSVGSGVAIQFGNAASKNLHE